MQAAVRIPGFDGAPSPVVRLLGIHLDSRLKWGPHVRVAANKAAAQMSVITRLTQSTSGASFAKARQIYSAAVRPVMSYGAETWFDPDDVRVGRNKQICPLQVMQNECLRTVSGAYKTTKVDVLEHESGMAPPELHLEKQVVTYALLAEQKESSAVIDTACDKLQDQALQRFRIRLTRSATRNAKL
ncbi:Hypothetical protein D9617_104g015930 [Elsinoe fawcettii]|nr:Hypothetical protein D9617_104g015930 [Elsinoe fawcettii]